MLKFKYHYLTNTLAYQPLSETELWYQLPETKQFTRFTSQGFVLEPQNHWINFAVYEDKIKVFYKQVSEPLADRASPKITYYRKYLPKQEEIIFTFSSEDEMEKVGNSWVKKGGSND